MTADTPRRAGTVTRVAVLDDYQSVAASLAGWQGSRHRLDVTFLRDHISDPEALAERLQDTDVIVAMRERTPLPKSLIARLPRLKLIVTTGMNNAAIATDAGVMVCGTPSLTSPTVELTWALITALSRNLCREAQALRAGAWQTSVGEGLEGSTLGLLGLGRIGSRVAKVGQAFGMRVIAWSQNLTPEAAREHGAERVGAEQLFRQADILSIHLRLSPRTRGLVGREQLQSMRPTARLVNTSRAGIVDQQALAEALRDGWIAGAGLDVFDEEPLPADHPLLDVPNALLTPHLGYVVRQNYELFFQGALEAVCAFLDGQPVRVLSDGSKP
jgi:phosphoglycerate dehydrogenase-like enzyme